MNVIDADSNVSLALPRLVDNGIVAVGRYYSSRPSKRLTSNEARAISEAGLKIFTVFEDEARPSLDNDTGIHHAQLALQQATQAMQPPGSAIYFALDSEIESDRLGQVRDYFQGIRDTLGGRYAIGVYGDGTVCADLLQAGLCDYTWLSASRGFPQSREYYASRRWSLAQDPAIDRKLFGLSIDYNEAPGEFGAFTVSGPLAPAMAAGPASASPGLDLATLSSAFNQLQRRGVAYVFGAKADERANNPRSNGRLSTPLDTVDCLDCSGFFRYAVYLASSGAITVPDGSQDELAWCAQQARAGVLSEVSSYGSVGAPVRSPTLFAAFIKPNTNGSGDIGHVWLVVKDPDGGQARSMECYGGHGVGSRPWDARELKAEVFATYQLPLAAGAPVA